uniref:Connectin-like n=3 Tax=Hirondellea gigas TaxID=1518452 RepID=A0A6A7G666_9CRUS
MASHHHEARASSVTTSNMKTSAVMVLLAWCCLLSQTLASIEKRNAEEDNYYDDEPPPTLSPDFNICDIKGSYPIYCYCNNINPNEATEGNCWIIDDMSNAQNQHIWEGLSTQSGIQSLTLHLRSDGILHRIPTVAIQHLPNIKSFEVQYGTIKGILPFNFANSTTLETISLARNSIEKLQKNAFAHLPSLSTLNFGENHLTDIRRGVFAHLPKLTHLSIDRNNITGIEDRAFVELHNLIELKLFTNQIKAIVPATFKGLKNLRLLDLHMNRLEVIGDLTFRALKSLQELDLHGNSIKYLAPDSFVGLLKLKTLNLQDNKLLSLEPTVFAETNNIMKLDLRYNVLETIIEDTMLPLLDNLNDPHMQFFADGNSFRCDDRLTWVFRLMNSTNSSHVRRSLKDIHCYLDGAPLPTRLTTVDTVTDDYVTTPLGIGPKIQLLRLKVFELPDHTRTQIPSTIDPDCEPTDNMIDTSSVDSSYRPARPRGNTRRRNHRGRARRPVDPSESSNINEPQSDTSMTAAESKSVNLKTEAMQGGSSKVAEPAQAEPVHEGRGGPPNGGTSNVFKSTGTWVLMLCLLALNLAMH